MQQRSAQGFLLLEMGFDVFSAAACCWSGAVAHHRTRRAPPGSGGWGDRDANRHYPCRLSDRDADRPRVYGHLNLLTYRYDNPWLNRRTGLPAGLAAGGRPERRGLAGRGSGRG